MGERRWLDMCKWEYDENEEGIDKATEAQRSRKECPNVP